MLTSKVAKRYAKGLLDFSEETGATDKIFSEMKDVVTILNQSKDLDKFLSAPFIDYRKKTEVASNVFKDFSVPSQNFIKLIIKQGREKQLKNIAQEYVNIVEDLNGLQKITLTSASKLSQQNIDDILKSTNLVNPNQKQDLKLIINPNILGGYILRVGDQQVDASVRSKLNQLRKTFQLN